MSDVQIDSGYAAKPEIRGRFPRHRFGSENQIEYIKDIGTANYYDRMIPYEDDIVKEAAYGEWLWKNGSIDDMTPEETLVAAFVGQAVLDFLETAVSAGSYCGVHYAEHISRQASVMLKFLKENPLTEAVYNHLEYLLRTEKHLSYVLNEVRRSYSRFMRNIGRTGKK